MKSPPFAFAILCFAGASLFALPAADAKTILVTPTTSGGIDVTTDANGLAKFSAALNGVGAPAYVTAVATNRATGDTSEIGACFLEDTIFRNGAEIELP